MPLTPKYAAVHDLLIQYHQLLKRRLEQSLKDTDLHVPSYRVLDLVDRSPGIALGEITAKVGVTGGAITTISRRLMKLKLLSCRRDSRDRRIVRPQVTMNGQAELRLARTIVEKELAAVDCGLSSREEKRLEVLLEGLAGRLRLENSGKRP